MEVSFGGSVLFVLMGVRDDVCVCVCVCVGSFGFLLQNFLKG